MENKKLISRRDTFGGSPAAGLLVDNINAIEDEKIRKKISKKVSNFLAGFNEVLHELRKIDSRIALGLAHSMYASRYHSDTINSLPIEVKTFTLNVLSQHYKVWLEEMDGNTPYKERIDFKTNLKK